MTRPWKDPLAATVKRRSRWTPRSPAPRPQQTTTEKGLGWEHQRRREQLLAAHRDGAPCPCLVQDDCGPACPCRPTGAGLPMYRDPRRNVDGRALEGDHTRARAQGGTTTDRLLISTCNRSRGAGAAPAPRPAPEAPAASSSRRVAVTSTTW